MTPAVTLYWRPRCLHCLRLKAALRAARIPYRQVNIRADPEAAATVRAVNGGNELVPTVRVGDYRFLGNPSLAEVRAALAAPP